LFHTLQKCKYTAYIVKVSRQNLDARNEGVNVKPQCQYRMFGHSFSEVTAESKPRVLVETRCQFTSP